MQSKYLLAFEEKDSYSRDQVGGKAFNLLELVRREFKVPTGFCLTTEGFSQFLEYNKIPFEENVTSLSKEEELQRYSYIRERILEGDFPEEMANEVLQYYDDVLQNKFASVRSSATCEDGKKNSFAGKFDTFLGISKEDILSNIKGCWASLYSNRVLRYQRAKKIKSDGKMGVIIQEIVNPDVAGVMFTKAVHGEAKGKTLIEAVYGLGESLVSGAVTPDRYIVNGLHEVYKELGSKSNLYNFDKVFGKVLLNVPIKLREQFALSDNDVFRLSELGQKVQNSFKAPQDIEWAIKAKEIYLLQTRPITA